MFPQYPNNIRRAPDAWPITVLTHPALPLPSSQALSLPKTVPVTPLKVSRTPLLAQLEAVLFLSKEPMNTRRIGQIADFPEGTKIRPLLRELNGLYDSEQSAFQVIEVAGGFQLRTRSEFAPWLVRLQEVPETVRLSTPVMETLAVIAYRQPVMRTEVEQIRGVHCGDLIRQLLDRELVRIVGRSEELGRPRLYGTTKTFLEVFGLGRLQDLPDFQELKRPETG